MFERYESVLDRVGVVTRRFRAIMFWWALAIIAAVTSVLGIWLQIQARSGELPVGLPAPRLAMALVLVTAVGAILASYLVRFTYRNPRGIAERIESRFPGLQQRLLTALSQSPDSNEQPLGYLQRRVITDAFRHSQTHRWTEAVPRGAAMLSRITGGLSLIVLAIVTSLLFVTKPGEVNNASSQSIRSPHVVIEPGNTEVEKGSGLVISARFGSSDLIPDQLDLFTRPAEAVPKETGEANRLEMTQSLDDPLLSAYVPTIEKPFQYQVGSSRWQSETYSVDVFEYPNLVRADAVLDFPDYTQLETKRVEDAVRVTAVEGTILRWNLQLNKPVTTLSIHDKDGKEVELDPSTLTEGRAAFEVTLIETERWTIELVDDKGRKNKYPLKLDARVTPNQPPDLKLVQGGDIVASPLEEVSLVANVQDDFEVIRAGISYSSPDGETKEVVLAEAIARGKKQRIEHMIALEQMKAKPDDLVSYHFWVEDNAADGSIRRTPGDLFFAEIGPFEEIFREGEAPAASQSQASQPQQGGAQQQAEELAELQKQIIAATWKVIRDQQDAQVSETFVTDTELLAESQEQAIELASELASATEDEQSKQLVETLTEQMQTAVKQLRQATAQVSKSPLTPALNAEQAAYQTLLRLRAREFEVSQSQRQQSQSSSSASAQRRQQQLDQLELENDENRYETQSQATDSTQQDAQSEDRQILSRLRELAQRQEDINKQLAQLQSAIKEAKTEEEKEEARRQLKRLREQEQELLRESDELADRMQQQENQENNEQISQQSEQLEETRENLRRSSEALEQDNVSEALAAGTRVERELDELSEEFRKRAAGEFDEVVRDLRTKARELEETQKQVGEQLNQLNENTQPGLRAGNERESIQQTLENQKAALGELMEKVQQTVEEAEPSEPLLAQNLYETFRKAQQKQLDRQMSNTGEMLERGLDPQAQQLQQQVAEGTSDLRRDLEKAADSVLGDEAKALERALNELERLDESLQSELARNSASPPREAGDAEQSNPASESEARPASERGENQSEAMSEQGEQQQPSKPNQDNPESTPSESQSGTPSSAESQSGQPAAGSGQRGEATERRGMLEKMSSESSAPAAGSAISSPIAGGGFREWSDALRDVEEMVGDPTLRSEAAVIRDRARQMRSEMRRHASEPQWELVESMIAKPLRELKMKVSEELLRRTADRAEPVPIDRDPVPDEYSNAVKRYYESLGSGR
jgi:hypothetical protein